VHRIAVPASGLPEAEATATKAVSSAVEEGNVQALNYFIAQKYVEAVTAIGRSSNAKVVLVPLEATALVGTVAGIIRPPPI
jgi:regulator of protease activity HflC (stomatin/prohibitin superfamily)